MSQRGHCFQTIFIDINENDLSAAQPLAANDGSQVTQTENSTASTNTYNLGQLHEWIPGWVKAAKNFY
jgi:hypothetical protein